MSFENEVTANPDFGNIKGWLAFMTFGFFITPIYMVYQLIPQFTNYKAAIDAGFSVGLVYFEIVGDLALIALFIYCAYLLVKHRKVAIRFITYVLLGSMIFTMIDSALVKAVLDRLTNSGVLSAQVSQTYADQGSATVGRTILIALIWIPYLRRSKRVEGTLIK